MSAIQLFRDHHKTIRGLFRQLEAIDVRAHEMKDGVVKETFMELEIHFQLEEEYLYPVIRSKADEDGRATLEGCRGAHLALRNRIQALRERGIANEYFNMGLSTLIAEAEEHLEEEEVVLFPLAKMNLGDQVLAPLEEQIRRRHRELMLQPRYRDALPEIVQNPNGGEQMRKRSGHPPGGPAT